MFVTTKTTISSLVYPSLINNHAGSEEGEGVDEYRHDANRTIQTE